MSLTRKRRSTGKVTLADVAQLAGVGTMTVSRALRTPEQVSDELACGALYECQRRRIKVPDELAVVGFGDSDVSRVCQPPLTTIAVPHRKIGIEAGRALLARLNDEEWSDRQPIASSLCLRDSC